MIQQPSLHANSQANKNVIAKLKKLQAECQNLRTDLNSVKNMTFKAKRKIDIDLRYVRDTFKTVLAKKCLTHKIKIDADQSDKENCMRAANLGAKLNKIEVKLLEEKPMMKLKIKEERGEEKKEDKKELRLSQKIMLELQEIKLLEQRQNLISKKNLRLNNYYSEHKGRIEPRRSITEQCQN